MKTMFEPMSTQKNWVSPNVTFNEPMRVLNALTALGAGLPSFS